MKRYRWILPLAALLLAASAIAGVAQPRSSHAADAPTKKTITVTGSGTVTTVPDRASFQFTVNTRGATAKAALAQNSTATAAVIAALKNAGVSAADLQTSQVSLSPQTNQDGTTIIGYLASNSVNAKSSIAKSGELVDTAVAAGADGVSGPMLSRSDADGLYRDALKDAVADAKQKADALASASGLTLQGVQAVVEGSQAPAPIAYAAKLDASTPAPIEPGTQEIDATVTVTYNAG